jgi:hypothetical protein
MNEAYRLQRLTRREISAGTDPDTGSPTLSLQPMRVSHTGPNLAVWEEDGPRRRYLLTPDAARRTGAALLLAADPGVAARLLTQGQPALLSAELEEGEAVLEERGRPVMSLETVGRINEGEHRRTLVQRLEDAAQALLDRVKAGAGIPMKEHFELEEALFALRHSKEKHRPYLSPNVRA